MAQGSIYNDSAGLLTTIRDTFYPVGTYYWSENATNPSTFIGGTWVQVKDRFILAAGDTYKVGATGGGATHTHPMEHYHGTAGHTLTTNEIPPHQHQIRRQQWYNADTVASTQTGSIYSWKSGAGTGGATSHSYWGIVETTGGGAAHSHGNTGAASRSNTDSGNNMPPYLVSYCFKRTA